MKYPVTILALLGATSSCVAQPTPNLVPDASFETPIPSWFTEEGKGAYFAAKENVTRAAEGHRVLAIQGWNSTGSKILSHAFDLSGTLYSGSLQARLVSATHMASTENKPGDVGVEFAIFDEKGEQKLASLGNRPLEGKGAWEAIFANAAGLSAPATRGRLGILITGSSKGQRLEIDQVGLFAGATTGPVTNSADLQWFEAEAMTGQGKGWKKVGHFESWYADLPSGMKMLDGTGGVANSDNAPATQSVKITTSGRYRLWMRFLHTGKPNNGKYTFALRQNGQELATKEIDDGDEAFGAPYAWTWVSIDANLSAGNVEVMLSRPLEVSSWVGRHVDMFVLTNQLYYEPRIQDFRPRGFLRWTNLSESQDPYCLYMFVRRNQGPVYYVNPGMLSSAGFNSTYYAPEDKTKWLSPGESSPWVDVSQYLLPGGGHNNISLLATRDSHVQGYVTGLVKGRLEFAVGDDKKIVRTVDIEQAAPRLLMTLPYDLQNQSEKIFTATDYLRLTEATLDKIGKPKGRVAEYLDLNVILGLDPKVDDPQIINREVEVIKRLGFNGTYTPLAPAAEAVVFNKQHGLEQHFGLWADPFYVVKNNCLNQPDVEKMEATYKEQAKTFAPILGQVERMKLSDEPSGPPYEHFAACDFCKEKFRTNLKDQGLTLQELGVNSWDDVVPVMPENREKQPALFYHTGIFRLQTFADHARASVAIKRKYLPDNVKTYVNYSPPLSEQLTWTQRGNDLFMTQRNGGLELGWTEDWLGYGASPQQISTMYAQLRAAGRPENQPLGGYMVGVSGGPLLQRIKYYTMIAAGVRHVNVYNYGPLYASMDSWSTLYERYPAFSAVQHELGVIDGALKGTSRRKTDIAILYNRTASIWAVNTNAAEQDARYIHWALAHAGYDADFIPEEDIEAGQLNRYKVLYLNGPQLRDAAATKIAGWVKNGGILFGSAGAGSLDEYNRPLDTLNAIFGASSENLKLENDAGRPKYELRSLPVLDELSTSNDAGVPTVAFNRLCFRETLTPAIGAKIILKTKDDKLAGVLHKAGKGTAIRVAALPGITYLNDAVRGKDYDIETYLPQNYSTALRNFIAWPAKVAKASTVAKANAPIAEIVRYDAADRAVLFIIDNNGKPRPNFTVSIPQAAQFKRAYTATGKKVVLKKIPGGILQASWPLDVCDAIVLQK